LGLGKRAFLRDLHAVTGFWVAGLALVMLTTGLPWAAAWGSALKAVRAEMGWVAKSRNGGKQDWTIGGQSADSGEHSGHDHAAMMAGGTDMPPGAHRMPDGSVMTMSPVSLSEMVARAKAEHLEFPVIVSPPGAKAAGWTVKSEAQNRPLRVSIQYDAMTGAELSRETFADKHPIDRVVGYGVAWHEGQLFGWINQLIGVATAIMLLTLAVSGFLMWRKRRPAGLLGAPPVPPVPARIRGVVLLILVLAALLPLLAASLVLMWLVERVVLRRLPAASNWLGLGAPA
jgi:uncharacterized iron-regulated membrane protein